MLVLSRKAGQRIMIGEDVTITVVSVQGGQVKLGVQAPRCVEVHREEILDRINRQKWEETALEL